MIPRLANIPGQSPIVKAYLNTLNAQGFSGDIADRYADRLSLATDNSVYQQLPQAIVFPKSIDDVVLLTQTAQHAEFQSLSFTPRGGGTGTNGQSLNDNIIVDMSRHMNHIVELNVAERWVRVQSGVVKDQLNQYLKPHGLFFSPELSTSNRATLGGMINTDASGQGSLKYGKTSDHVLALTSVLMNGEVLETGAIRTAHFDEDLHQLTDSESSKKLHQQVFERCRAIRPTVIKELPDLNRFLTGYDLKNVFDDETRTFNLSRILTGSEGSLAFICEAKLNLLPIPKQRTLLNIKYDSFDSALRSAPMMIAADALSVETIDSTVLNLAKQDIIWHSVSDLLKEDDSQPILGINMVEYASNNAEKNTEQVKALCRVLDEKIANKEQGIIGYQVCEDLPSIEKVYAMRKKAVGLLGNAEGRAKPIAFVEDTCVPPENLADYIVDFRALLDSYQLDYGMFGHVDAGVLHVRPALDLCDSQQVETLVAISDKVVELTRQYGGLIWGEHGKGMRSGYGETFFGEKLWQELRYIKQLFDPNNRLNPGKICTPLDSEAELYPITSTMRADYDRNINIAVRDEFQGAMNCNGNGLCFNFDVNSTMCPSFKVSGNRVFSPKGRAALVREWLQLLAKENVKPETLIFDNSSSSKISELVSKVRNQFKRKDYDFSHEVKDAMETCLACKACASQCPIKIDVPTFRAQFNALYHQRYLRPVKDHVVAKVERMAPLMAKQPKLFNVISNNKISQLVAGKTLGMSDLPTLSSPNLDAQLKALGEFDTLEQLEALAHNVQNDLSKHLLIVQDPFTSFYDAEVVADFVALAQKLGFKPTVLPFKPSGKAEHVKGFLTQFAKTAQNQADFLNRVAQLGIPMVGVDAALVLIYREEYKDVLGDKRGDFTVQLPHEWLAEQIMRGVVEKVEETDETPWYLFSHCTESTALPNSPSTWQQIFTHLGQTLVPENTGCCGMAGTFGHETKHLAMSKAIYAQSWQTQLADKPHARCLATGFSCRSQVKRMENTRLKHPVQALLSVC